jgi:hypothetical protein
MEHTIYLIRHKALAILLLRGEGRLRIKIVYFPLFPNFKVDLNTPSMHTLDKRNMHARPKKIIVCLGLPVAL